VESAVVLETVKQAVVASLGVAVGRVEPVAGSVANEDFRIHLRDGRQVFVKIGPRRELVAEVWAIERVASTGVPVPTVLAYEDDPAATPFPLLALDLLPSDGDLTAEVFQAVGRAMKAVHAIEVAGYGQLGVRGHPLDPDSVTGEYASWQDFVASIVGDTDVLARSGLLTARQRDRVHRGAKMIDASPLAGDAGALLHGDLKRQHILAVRGVPTGLIDWGDAGVGDPAWDLARASMMDPTDFRAIVDGYPGADDAAVSRLLPIYRVLWNVRALAYEHRAGGDWFAAYQDRIAADLDLL
jgi:aminoglycoside phosphotransferase (APT) family kinase protein